MFRLVVCLMFGLVILSVDMTYIVGALLAGAYLWLMAWLIRRWYS